MKQLTEEKKAILYVCGIMKELAELGLITGGLYTSDLGDEMYFDLKKTGYSIPARLILPIMDTITKEQTKDPTRLIDPDVVLLFLQYVANPDKIIAYVANSKV